MSVSKCSRKSDKTISPTGSFENISSLPSITTDQEGVDDLDILDTDILHRMDIEDIQDLKKFFFDEEKIKNSDPKHFSQNLAHGVNLSKAEFIEALEQLSGNQMIALGAAKLFENLDKTSLGYLRWENVLDAIIENTGKPLEKETNNWQPINSEVDIYYASHCKREHIIKVVPLYTKLTFCYAVVSKLGRVGVYDGEFNLLDTYNISLKPTTGTKEYIAGEKEERQRRSNTTWVTDAVFVPDSYAIFFSASDRSLHLYDATGLIHVPLCLISGLKNTPTCMDYYSSNDFNKPSLLFFGDDEGDVTMMQFHQAKKSLFRKKDPDKLDKFLWSELKEQADYVTCYVQTKVHDDTVLQISYSAESKTVLSSSNDPIKTMVLRHVEKRRRPYIFKVPRGIKCFHLEKSLHIVVTGSKDGVVRVWNQVVTKQPIVSLHGHRAPVMDVRVLKQMSAIISLSEKAVVKIWDVNDYYCLMSLPINFPILKILGSKIDFGSRSIFPGPSSNNIFDELGLLNSKDNSKINSLTDEIETWLSTRDFEVKEDEEWSRDCVLVTCCNYIAVLKLTPLPSDSEKVPELLKKYKILPPPAREHYASVPSPWKIADSFTKTPPEESEEASTTKSSSSSSTSKNVPIIKSYKKVQNMTADPVKAPMGDMNTKRTQIKIKQEQMKMLVQHCAPHLALDLYDLVPIKFSRPLPVTRGMMEKGIDVSDPEILVKGKMQAKDSTVTTTGETISDVLLSPHSSKSSKLTAQKRIIIGGKDRQTPDWLAERIKTPFSDSSESSEINLKLNE